MIRLKTIYLTSFSLFENSSLRKMDLPVSLGILMVTLSPPQLMRQSMDSLISERVSTVLPAGTKGPIVDSIYFHLVRRTRMTLSASQNSSGSISKLYWWTIKFSARFNLKRLVMTEI